MKKRLAKVTKRLVAAVVGVSGLTMHAPAQNQNLVARSRQNIQTDKARLFYANFVPMGNWFVEQVLPGTSESKAATENLKLIAKTF